MTQKKTVPKKTKVGRIQTLSNCQVEWDRDRGVLYVHNKETGHTVLRVCGLEPCQGDLSAYGQLIDISLRHRGRGLVVTYPVGPEGQRPWYGV